MYKNLISKFVIFGSKIWFFKLSKKFVEKQSTKSLLVSKDSISKIIDIFLINIYEEH